MIASGWFWASGGMVSTPADFNALRPRLRGGRPLRPARPARSQRKVFEGGAPIRLAREELGRLRHLPLRDEVRDGVGPHGQLPGYTQFLAASPTASARLRCP